MSDAFKPLVVILLVAVALGVVLAAPKLFERSEVVRWNSDVAGARSMAQTQGRPLLLYFTADWCEPCQRMKHGAFADAEVDCAVRARYVPVKIDIDRNRQIAREFAIEAMPTFKVVSPQGEVVKQVTGGMDAKEFLQWLTSPTTA